MGSAAAHSDARSERTEALYRAHGAAVFKLCRSLLRDRTDAEDATQQVFLSAHRALRNGVEPREPLAWLLAVARHECYARFRQRAAAPLPGGDAEGGTAADASAHVLRAGELASLWEEIGQLPAAQREAFLLREIRGLSYGQLAAELSLSKPSVRSLLLRARTRLRRRLGDVAAALGSAPWVQALLRLGGGGDGPSPVPAATKAAAIGLGAVALAGGGASLPRVLDHASSPSRHATVRHEDRARVPHAAVPVAVVSGRHEDHSAVSDDTAEHAIARDDGSRSSGSGSGSGGGTDDAVAAESSGEDGGATATTPLTVQPTTTESRDGGSGGGSSSGSGGGTTTVSDSHDGGGSGGSDDGGGTTTVTDGGGGGHDGGRD
jgi:RNA polymerase sigma-70 factor (ECF subfamily)